SILQFVSAQVAMAIDRKRGEERLRDSENRYRLLFESNPEAMWVYDVETLRFLAVNEAAVRHYGYSRQEFLALSIRDIRPSEEQERLEAALQHAATGAATHADARQRTTDGTFIQVELSADSIDFDALPPRRVVVVAPVGAGLGKMLRRGIGDDIEFATVLRHGVGRVKAGPGQREQVIINVAVNSRDAMPQGGRLTIETAHAAVDEVGGPGQVP